MALLITYHHCIVQPAAIPEEQQQKYIHLYMYNINEYLDPKRPKKTKICTNSRQK